MLSTSSIIPLFLFIASFLPPTYFGRQLVSISHCWTFVLLHLLWNNPDHPALHQWGAYIKEFTSIFGPHNAMHNAEIALVKLKMFDNNRFSNFLVWFEAEAFKTGWDYQAIAFHLCTSITPCLQEGLQNVAPTMSYAELKGALMQIDTQYWETEAEHTLYIWPANKPFNTNTAQWTTPTDKPSTTTSPNTTRGPAQNPCPKGIRMTPGTQSPCQTWKMQIPHHLFGIPRCYHYTRGSSHGPKESPGYPTLASTDTECNNTLLKNANF